MPESDICVAFNCILIKAKKVLGIWICLLEAGRVHVC